MKVGLIPPMSDDDGDGIARPRAPRLALRS